MSCRRSGYSWPVHPGLNMGKILHDIMIYHQILGKARIRAKPTQTTKLGLDPHPHALSMEHLSWTYTDRWYLTGGSSSPERDQIIISDSHCDPFVGNKWLYYGGIWMHVECKELIHVYIYNI